MNWALRNGETVHGITIHRIDTGIDTGPVIAEALFSIWPDIQLAMFGSRECPALPSANASPGSQPLRHTS
ncbi:hypothetical protein GCM10022226_83200 [Sphaerisporangium flaviroseum]|uniref:Formyl transferase N-terminal domain-containing protein n=1 Tax=Sphaerisporangium flaviroseum TaxID=509199 RepID=A0ABP7JLK9_9ACTN